MAEINLDAQARTEFGKGAARRVRRAGRVPAVLYGHGTDPVHISLPGHETALALRQANALLNLQLAKGETQLALPKQVQRDPVKGSIEHVDLIIVRRGEKVRVEVPITLVGEAGDDTLVIHDRTFVNVLADPTNIPGSLELSIEGLEVGAQLTVADLVLPEGVQVEDEADLLIVNITNAPTQEELEADLETEGGEEAEGDEEAAEGDEAADEEAAEE